MTSERGSPPHLIPSHLNVSMINLFLTLCHLCALLLSAFSFFKINFLEKFFQEYHHLSPGRVAQSVTCLATDASLTADPGVAS